MSASRRLGAFALALTGILMVLSPGKALAHGFGERTDLPVPVWLYITGAAAAVAFSFLVYSLVQLFRPTFS